MACSWPPQNLVPHHTLINSEDNSKAGFMSPRERSLRCCACIVSNSRFHVPDRYSCYCGYSRRRALAPGKVDKTGTLSTADTDSLESIRRSRRSRKGLRSKLNNFHAQRLSAMPGVTHSPHISSLPGCPVPEGWPPRGRKALHPD